MEASETRQEIEERQGGVKEVKRILLTQHNVSQARSANKLATGG